jgi:chromosome segregation ATPase
MIDWTRFEEKPDKEVKVTGQVLLDFRSKVQDQTIEINNLRSQIEKLSGNKRMVETNLKNSEFKGSQLSDQIREINANMASAINEKDEEIAELNGKIAEGETKANGLQANIDELNSKIEALEGEKAALQSEKNEITNEKDRLNAKIAMFEQKVESLNSQLGDLNARIAEMESTIADQDRKNKELEPVSPESEFHSENRIICPMCGSTDIKNVEDKNRVLSYVGHVPIYAKKRVCKKCSYEFI